jgi:hypothetical protein
MATQKPSMCERRMSNSSTLDWRAIIIACLVSLVGLVVIGFVWGIIGFALYATAGEEGIDTISQGIFGNVIGIFLSLIPIVIGAVYLTRCVSDEIGKHCLVFGVVSLALTVALALAYEDFGFAWNDIVYYLAIVPTALLGQFIGERI